MIICTGKETTFANLVTEDFDLAVGSVNWFVAPVVVAVRINLNHKWKSFHSFLRGEICAQTVHCDKHLGKD